MEEFRLKQSEEVSAETVQARPGNVLVAVRNPYHLGHLEKALAETDTNRRMWSCFPFTSRLRQAPASMI